jgi:hypothetical protein
MKYSSRQTGSAVVIVILVLSAVAVWCLVMLKSIDLHTEMALKRQEYEQGSQLAEGVMRYGIWLCKTRFTTLIGRDTGKVEYDFDVGSWKLEGEKIYTGTLHCSAQNESVNLRVQVYNVRKICIHTITCQLVRQHEKNDGVEQEIFVVRHWVAQGEAHGKA